MAARCRRKQSATALYSTTLTWQTGFAVIASHAICACVRVLDRHNVLTIATFCLRSCCHCIGVYMMPLGVVRNPLSSAPLPFHPLRPPILILFRLLFHSSSLPPFLFPPVSPRPDPQIVDVGDERVWRWSPSASRGRTRGMVGASERPPPPNTEYFCIPGSRFRLQYHT